MNNTNKKSIIKNIALLLIVAIFFSSDRYLKYLAVHDFSSQSFNLLGSFLKFSLAKNYYIAFSLPLYGWVLNTLISLIIISLIFYIFYLISAKDNRKPTIYPLTLILFGAISNLTDRLVFGYVIDYFDFKYFTVFNLADMMISGGVIYLIYKLSTKNKYD